MTREEAIDVLVEQRLAAMGPTERATMLAGWWGIDEDDPEYGALPDELKAELARGDEPGDAMAPHCAPLLRIALRHAFVGVVNAYLEQRLAALGRPATVDGAVEVLAACPCCRFRTLDERGAYDICQVCFWQDTGSDDPDIHSGPNHMTLREARDNFARLGAVTERERAFVLPDGKERYARADEPGAP